MMMNVCHMYLWSVYMNARSCDGDCVDMVDSYRFSDCWAEFGRKVYINDVQPFQLNSNRIMFLE